MRKRTWLIGLVLMAILAVVFGTSAAFAYGTPNPDTTDADGGWWDMEEQCHGEGGMMAGYGDYHMGLTDPVTLERVAGTLGLTYEQLMARLTQGETIAQVAEAQGVNPSLVVATILAPYNEILQVRVKYGYLTEAQAQATLEQLQLWIEQVMTQSLTGYQGTTGSPATTYGPRAGGGMMGGGVTGNGMMGGGMMGGGMMGGGTMGGGMMGGGMMGNW